MFNIFLSQPNNKLGAVNHESTQVLSQKMVMEAISDNNLPLAENFLQTICNSAINKELFDVKAMLLSIASGSTVEMLKLFLQWPIVKKNLEDYKFSEEMLWRACSNSVGEVGIVENLLDLKNIQNVLENDIHSYHLRSAMQTNSIDLVKLLLNQDSVLKNINTHPDWILTDASECKNVEILKLLMSQKELDSYIKDNLVTYIKDLSQKLVMQAISDNNLPLAKRSLQALWDSGINQELFDVKAMLLSIANSGTVEMLKLFLQWPIFEKNFEDDKFSQEMLTKACFNSVDGLGIVENLLDLKYIQKVLKKDIYSHYLRCAIQVDSIDLVKLLLNQDSVLKNINTHPDWILTNASKCENIEILKLLMSQKKLDSYIKDNLVTYIKDLSQKLVMKAISDNNFPLAERSLQALWDSGIDQELFDVKAMLLLIASNGTAEMLKLFLQWPIFEKNFEDDETSRAMLWRAYLNSVDGVGIVENLLDLQSIQNVLANDIHGYHLNCAIQENSMDIVKLLLNQYNVLKNINTYPDCILTDASKCGNVEILKLLLSQKALDSYIKDNLVTYIGEALLLGNLNTAQFLIAYSPFNEEKLIEHLYNKPKRLKNFLKLEYGLNYVNSKSKTIFLDIVNLRKRCTSQYDYPLYDEVIKILLSMPEIKNEQQSLKEAHNLLSKCYHPTKEILDILKEIMNVEIDDMFGIFYKTSTKNNSHKSEPIKPIQKNKHLAIKKDLAQKMVMEAISDNNLPLAEKFLQTICNSAINKELFDVKAMLLLIASNGTTKMLKLFLQWPIVEKNLEDYKFSEKMLTEACFNSVDGVGIVESLLALQSIQKVLKKDIYSHYLRFAIQANSMDIVKLLLNQDSVLKNINTHPNWILTDASKCENIEILKLLMSQKELDSYIKDNLVTYIKDLSQKLVMKAISDNNFPLAERSLQALWDSGIDQELFDVKAMLLLIASNGTTKMLKLFLQWPIVEKNLEDYKFSEKMLTEACFNSVGGVGIVENLLDLQYIQKVLEEDIHNDYLRYAIQANSIDLVKLLLNQDSVLKNINTDPNWILTDASECKNVEILKLLLSQKALDSYIKDNLVTYIDKALLFGNINAAQFLISHSPFNEEKLIEHLYNKPKSLKNFLKLEYGLNYVKSKSKTIFLDIVNLRKRCTSQYDCPLYDEVIKILLSMPEIKNEHQSLKEAHNLLLECYHPTKEILDILKEIMNVEIDDMFGIFYKTSTKNNSNKSEPIKSIQKNKHLAIKKDLAQKMVMEAISDNNLPLAEKFLQTICNSAINKNLFDAKAMLLSIAKSGTVDMLKLFLQWRIVEKNFEDDEFSEKMLTKACSNSVGRVGIVENLLYLKNIQNVLENDIHCYHLRCAIQVDSIDLVKLLLNQDSVLKNINTHPDWILTDAIKYENIEILKLLLSQKALDSHIKDNLITYIGEALGDGKLNAAQFLIAHPSLNEEKLINNLYDNPKSLKNFLKLEYGLNYVKSKSKTIFLDIVKLRNTFLRSYDCSLYDKVIKILLSMPEIKNEHQSLKKAHNLLLWCYYPPKEILEILKEILDLEIDDKQNPKIKTSYLCY